MRYSDSKFETPNLSRARDVPKIQTNHLAKKRSASPVSIAEAAELASLQRRSKKPRVPPRSHLVQREGTIASLRHEEMDVFEDVEGDLLTPRADAEASRKFKLPNKRPTSRRLQLKPSDNRKEDPEASSQNSSMAGLKQNFWRLQEPILENQGFRDPITSPTSQSQFHTGSETRFPASVVDGPGISATPPIAESDLEPILPFNNTQGEEMSLQQPVNPAGISVQDASLPSPSLSPITAARNLDRRNSLMGDEEDDNNAMSVLDISEGFARHEQDTTSSKVKTKTRSMTKHGQNVPSSNNSLSSPTLMDIPMMLDSFDAMPDNVKSYVMYQLLRRCSKSTLHMVADVVNPALKCDFIGLLPTELSLCIVKYLDFQSMCRAAQVSRKWRQVINSDEKAWKDLLETDGYVLPEGDLERAVREGWGWQYPHSSESFERDLSSAVIVKPEIEASSPSSSSSSTVGLTDNDSNLASFNQLTRPKRKAASKFSSSKKRKVKATTPSKGLNSQWLKTLEDAQGPNGYASAAIKAIPNPSVGLPSLRNLHLYKTLYQRHHMIRKSWMQEDTKPQHITFRAHGRHVVTCLQFDTDKILTGSDDTNINVYDTKTGALRTRLEGHEGGVWALQYEGNILVSGSTDRSVRVWDIEKGKVMQVFQGHTSTVRCLVILMPTVTGTKVDGTPIYMPKEPLIITGSRDFSLRVWKLPKIGDPPIFQAGPPANDHDNPYFVRALTGHHHSVRAIAAHGDTLVSGSYDCTVRVWKISTGEVVYRLQGHTQKVYSVVLDHARNRCISGSMDYLVKVWSLETGACLFNLEGHTSLVGLLDLSHERLVSAAADSTLRIWDPENGQCKATLTAHTGAITCFQHDGQKVISGSDRTLKMWNIKTGECVKDLLTDLSGVWQVKFNERRCVAAVQRDSMTYIEVSPLVTILLRSSS